MFSGFIMLVVLLIVALFFVLLEVGFRSEELWITVINRMLTDRKEGYRCGCCSVCRRLYLQYGM